MSKYVVFLILGLAALSGCKSSVTDNLITRAEQKCMGGSDCVITLKEVTKFEWDKVYFFPNWTTSDSISSVIKIKYYADVPDQYTRMLFVYKGKIVHEEDYPELDYKHSMISFDEDSSDTLKLDARNITPYNALFKVSKSKLENSCADCFSYNLTPIKN